MDIKGQDGTKKAWELDKNAGLSFALAVCDSRGEA